MQTLNASLCVHVTKVSMSSLTVLSTDVLPLGPIDNTPLLEVGGADHTHTLVDSASYRKLSHSTWSYFYETYGGGPVIVTSLSALSELDESTVK